MTLLLDLTWVFQNLVDLENSETNQIPSSLRIVSKTGRGVRIGSRAGRIVRLARLFRTTRIFSLYQQTRLNFMNPNFATHGDTMVYDET